MNLKTLVSRINLEFSLMQNEEDRKRFEYWISKSVPESFDFTEEIYQSFLNICKEDRIRRPTVIQIKKALEMKEKPRYFRFESPIKEKNKSCEICNGTGIKMNKENNKILGFKYLEKDGKKIPELCGC